MSAERNLLPEREHVWLWRRQVRPLTIKAIREWRDEVTAIKRDAPAEVADPTDTIIICNAILMAINEELEVRRG